jgi:hypothetical protein
MPLPETQGSTFQHFLPTQPPINSDYFDLYKTPRLPPPSFQSPQDLNAQEAGSASLPAGSSYHTMSSKKHRRDSLSLLCHHHGQSSTTPIAHTQEDVRLKLSCQRSINGRSNLKEHAMLPLKIIHYKPSGPNDTAQLPITPLQTIVVPTQSLEQVKDESHALMVILIFENGFFLMKPPLKRWPMMHWTLPLISTQMIFLLY